MLLGPYWPRALACGANNPQLDAFRWTDKYLWFLRETSRFSHDVRVVWTGLDSCSVSWTELGRLLMVLCTRRWFWLCSLVHGHCVVSKRSN